MENTNELAIPENDEKSKEANVAIIETPDDEKNQLLIYNTNKEKTKIEDASLFELAEAAPPDGKKDDEKLKEIAIEMNTFNPTIKNKMIYATTNEENTEVKKACIIEPAEIPNLDPLATDETDTEKKVEEKVDDKLKPLTKEQRVFIGAKSAKLYEAALVIQDAKEKGNDVDIIDLALHSHIIGSKHAKILRALKDPVKKQEAIDYLSNTITSTADEIIMSISMEEFKGIGNMMPLELAKYYFSQNDAMFNYSPETNDRIDPDNKTKMYDVYKDSLHLTTLLDVVQDHAFHKGLRKRINRNYKKYVEKINACLTAFLKNKKSRNGSVSNAYKYLMMMVPDITENQAKAYVMAIAYMIETHPKNELGIAALAYLTNMNITAILPLVRGVSKVSPSELVDSGLIFYNSLLDFFRILKRKNKNI